MAVVKRPFISESGFQSTGFSVDTAGNVTVPQLRTHTSRNRSSTDFNVEENSRCF